MRVAIFGTFYVLFLVLSFYLAPTTLLAQQTWDSTEKQRQVLDLMTSAAALFQCEEKCRHAITNEFAVRLEGGVKSVILAKSQPDNFDCHACAPELSAFVFASHSGQWELEKQYIAFTQWGSWGSFSGEQATLKALSDTKLGIFLEGGYGNQGYFGTYVHAFSMEASQTVTALKICLSVDNSGAVGDDANRLEQWEVDYQVGLVLASNGQSQATISLQKRDLNNGAKQFKPTELRYDGTRFVETSNSGAWQENCF